MRIVQLYAHAAPAHEHAVFIASRPLPGDLIGRAGGMVYDVKPEFAHLARRDDGQLIQLITPAGLEQLAVRLLAEDGGRYTRAAYEEAGVWDPEEIARQHGHALITIEPAAGVAMVDATEADDLAAGLAPSRQARYVTVTVVVRTAATDPSELVDQALHGTPDVMWCGTEEGVTAAALAGGADPSEWPQITEDTDRRPDAATAAGDLSGAVR